ncbi:hypothetical protein GJ688_05940 [Heliobacillus mobilis]|uniref:SLH domain-containing protein n=1 Tax=Heliobacterium mobile TaxID=28064 RepID=A0A6I3SI09_HELMO|nr:YcdB/YcdC domain-containing protein [Heliobacterium mobile]MTV48523.1 hypothetical protein [Heliobacterium mobile]
MSRPVPKLLAASLTALLLTSAVPMGYAEISATANAEVLSSEQAKKKSASTLAEAIQLARSCFDIPPDYDQFTSNYETSDKNHFWSLNWSCQKVGEEGSINIRIDADTGLILNMFESRGGGSMRPDAYKTRNISRQGALAKAKAIMQKALGDEQIAEMELLDNSVDGVQWSPWEREGYYHFEWRRKTNGIPFPGDGVSVSVAGSDGHVNNYSFTWTKESLPSPQNLISVQQAVETFKNTPMLELQYILQEGVHSNPKEKRQAGIVYRMYNRADGNIDAFTGKPITPPPMFYEGYGFVGGGMGGMGSGVPENAKWTPQEQAAIKLSTNLVKKETALAAVMKWLALPPDSILNSAQLLDNPDDKQGPVWSFYWVANKSHEMVASAAVSAKTGELYRFETFTASENQPGQMNRQEAQPIAEEFLKTVQSKKFSQTKLDNYDMRNFVRADGKNMPYQTFRYRQMVNGVPFMQNYLEVNVDTVNKRIASFTSEWGEEISFPTLAGVLSPEQAADKYLAYSPMTLCYTTALSPLDAKTPKLVYKPVLKPGMSGYNSIDGRTGQPLDWNGQAIALPIRDIFQDTRGHRGEKEIKLLAQMNLFREYGEDFHPDEEITTVSLLRAIYDTHFGKQDGPLSRDENVMRYARQNNWIDANVKAEDKIDRLNLAKIIVRYCGLERSARLSQIYKVPFSDADAVPVEGIGYVVIADALGIVPSQEGRFLPDQKVTRADAAVAVAKMLNLNPDL